ncbi:hypothetical protein OCH239_09080 [Roseivivax halodurans JCM 10272]|uniref:Uncharacterized protein n=1 Tax=Roseivivax halodurans JCM 10272 TaxID=1449350 RepID=X7ECM2_9RHOB|nr:hypothetical protein OCH239_09080 [Roseivivax halodurans JCM 10272]
MIPQAARIRATSSKVFFAAMWLGAQSVDPFDR